MQLNGSALNVEELNGGTSFVTLELSTATLTFVANTCQLKREVPLQPGSLDFSRQIMYLAVQNNLTVAAFDFAQPGVSAAQGATLSTAVFTAWAANALQLAITNQLAAGVFDLVGQPTGQAAAVNLTASALNLTGQDVAPTRSVALSSATFDFVGQTSTPAAVVTLTAEVITFVPLDVAPANAPLGEVVNLDPATFGFAQNSLRVTNGITLDLALFNLVPLDLQNSVFTSLTASDLKLTPQSVTVVQVPVVIELTTAIFDFTQGSLQLTGISSAGDRKRMLFGVGR